MSLSTKANRRNVKVVCSEAIKVAPEDAKHAAKVAMFNEKFATLEAELLKREAEIAKQENAMWVAYRREQQRLNDMTPKIISSEDEHYIVSAIIEEIVADTSDVIEDLGFSRFFVSAIGPAHRYPTGKRGKTSKDRRYLPAVKKSDAGKIHGKLKKGSYSQLKQSGISLTSEDLW